jgi:uncharacterized protein (TIGR04255 family)
MDAKHSGPLPEFESPPVSEVALSVEFLPLPDWRGSHAGLYWSHIRKDYPRTDVRPPIPSQIEKFGEGLWQPPLLRIEISNPDVTRSWFITEDRTRLVQIQRDRFIINWRKVHGSEVYPRYDKEMRPRFEREWGHFKQFINDENLGTIDVQQCEVTYVNDVVKGEGWNTIPESLTLLSHWVAQGSDGFLPAPEQLNMAASFQIPDDQGRLHFTTQFVLRQIDNREAFQMHFVARGKPKSSSNQDVIRWLDSGREWIVRGFTDMTSRRAHELWKRRR